MDGTNKLYFGDNLKILLEHVPDASVDLIYLDPACAGRPPFNSSATYSFSVAPLYERRRRRSQTGATAGGEESAAQIIAFEDIRQPRDSGAGSRRQFIGKSSRAAGASWTMDRSPAGQSQRWAARKSQRRVL